MICKNSYNIIKYFIIILKVLEIESMFEFFSVFYTEEIKDKQVAGYNVSNVLQLKSHSVHTSRPIQRSNSTQQTWEHP